MSDFQIRKAQADDLPAMQAIARRTIDKCYRTFLGDEGVEYGFMRVFFEKRLCEGGRRSRIARRSTDTGK